MRSSRLFHVSFGLCYPAADIGFIHFASLDALLNRRDASPLADVLVSLSIYSSMGEISRCPVFTIDRAVVPLFCEPKNKSSLNKSFCERNSSLNLFSVSNECTRMTGRYQNY